jgi:hypothetical protein
MILAPEYFAMPSISCWVEILPQPIDATLIVLLGEFFPNTVAGTIVGIPLKINEPVATLAEVFKKFLLLTELSFFFIASMIFEI